MKFLKIAMLGLALSVVSAPAWAQLTADSDKFIDAVKKNDGATGMSLLEGNPTIVDTPDSAGDTALIIAITRSDVAWTSYLLNHGADPNRRGAGGDTPLIAAARVGFDDAASWLLAIGAKVDLTNKMSETPLIIAVQRRNVPLVKRFLQSGADPDRTDSAAGYSARDYARRDSRSREIEKLIEAKKPKASASSN
jgi:uncharacterized protein